MFNMKSIIFLGVLAVLSVCVSSEEALEEPVSGRANLILGSIGNGDSLYFRNTYTKRAQANTVQSYELTFSGTNLRITAIRAMEIGPSQGATARLVSGGISQRNAKIRLQTARGGGYNYQVEIWGQRTN